MVLEEPRLIAILGHPMAVTLTVACTHMLLGFGLCFFFTQPLVARLRSSVLSDVFGTVGDVVFRGYLLLLFKEGAVGRSAHLLITDTMCFMAGAVLYELIRRGLGIFRGIKEALPQLLSFVRREVLYLRRPERIPLLTRIYVAPPYVPGSDSP